VPQKVDETLGSKESNSKNTPTEAYEVDIGTGEKKECLDEKIRSSPQQKNSIFSRNTDNGIP
jgi:hypothetical protein